MADDRARSTAALSDEIAVAKARAIHTPFMLPFYDILVHGVSNRLAWRCPTRRLLDLYNAKGVFNSHEDDLDSLSRRWRQCFGTVDIAIEGLVAVFRAASPIGCLAMATNAPARVRSFAPVHG